MSNIKITTAVRSIKNECRSTWLACMQLRQQADSFSKNYVAHVWIGCGLLAEICFMLFDADNMDNNSLLENVNSAVELAAILAANLVLSHHWPANNRTVRQIASLPEKLRSIALQQQLN